MTRVLKERIKAKEAISLEMASNLKNLELVQIMVEWITSRWDFNEEQTFQISLAIGEAVCNAIIHGNKKDLQKKVKIKFYPLPNGLKTTIQDEGEGFDPKSMPDPLKECNLLKNCGRGLYYMKSYMDEVHFNCLPQGKGMLVTLLKRVNNKETKKPKAYPTT